MPVREQYNKLSETDRARALGCLDAGMRSREVGRRFHTSHQTINRIRQRYRQAGQFKDMPRSGRPKVTTRAEDRYIATTVARNRFVKGPQTRRRLYRSPACICSDCKESHPCKWIQVKGACKEAKTYPTP